MEQLGIDLKTKDCNMTYQLGLLGSIPIAVDVLVKHDVGTLRISYLQGRVGKRALFAKGDTFRRSAQGWEED